MYNNRRSRRFRRRPNGRNRSRHNGEMQPRLRTESYSNDQTRNRHRTTQSAEKLFEKYNTLAKEALSSGDKTLSENYFQHADHFMRVIEDKNKNQNQNIKTPTENKTVVNENTVGDNLPSSLNKDEKK